MRQTISKISVGVNQNQGTGEHVVPFPPCVAALGFVVPGTNPCKHAAMPDTGGTPAMAAAHLTLCLRSLDRQYLVSFSRLP